MATSREKLPPISVIGTSTGDSGRHPEQPDPIERISNRSRQRRIALVVGIVLAIVLLGFAATRSSSDGEASEGRSSNTPEPAATEQSAVQPSESAPGAAQSEAGDGPIFPDAEQWAMLARTSRGLVVIDLATGTQRIERNVLRHPILVTEKQVVYGQTQTGVLHTAPLTDLGDTERLPGRLLATPSSTQDQVWVVSDTSDLPTDIELSLVELTTLEIIRRVPSTTVRSSFSRLDAVSLVAPELATSPAGGTYRLLAGGDYEQISDGSLVTHGYGLALLERCDSQLQCRFFWIDPTNGAELDRPVPDAGTGPFVITGGGQWLVDLGSGRTLLNTETGDIIDLGTRPTESISVSPDGRYAAYRREGGTVLEVMDTTTGEIGQVKDLQLLSIASNGVFPPAVFVPTVALAP